MNAKTPDTSVPAVYQLQRYEDIDDRIRREKAGQRNYSCFGESEVANYERALALRDAVDKDIASGGDGFAVLEAANVRREPYAGLTDTSDARAICWQQLAFARDDLRHLFGRGAPQYTMVSSRPELHNRQVMLETSIRQMIDTPDGREFIQLQYGKTVGDFTLSDFVRLWNMSAPDDLLYSFASRHVGAFYQKQRELATIVAATREELRGAVLERVADGSLPASAAHAFDRLADVDVRLTDMLQEPLGSTLGTNNTLGTITVSSEMLIRGSRLSLRHTLAHEFLHELSGRSIIADGRAGSIKIYGQRLGLALYGPSPHQRARNVWLNEAVTEWLTLKLIGSPNDTGQEALEGSAAYVDYRKELNRLFANGLEPSLVLEAYFENVPASQAPGTKGRHMRALVERVNEIDGPGALGRIENNFVAAEIIDRLHRDGFIQPADAAITTEQVPAGAKAYTVTLQVGNSEVTTTQPISFRYVCLPGHDGLRETTAGDQLAKLQQELTYYKNVSAHQGKHVHWRVESIV